MDMKEPINTSNMNGTEIQRNDKLYQRRNAECKQWSAQQLDILVEAQKQFGNNWKKIADLYFPGRNANQIKCKFTYLKNKMTCPINVQKRKNQDYISSMLQISNNSLINQGSVQMNTTFPFFQMDNHAEANLRNNNITSLSMNAPYQKQTMSIDSSVNVNNPEPEPKVIYKVLDNEYFDKFEEDIMNCQQDVLLFDATSFNEYLEMVYIGA